MAFDKIKEKIYEAIIWKRRSSGSRGKGFFPTTTIRSDYHARDGDAYIGICSEKVLTVYLPPAARDGQIIVVKAEMKPPLGNRKINIATTDGSTIDGYSEDCITVSHGSKTFIRNNGNWFIIS